MNFVYKLEAAKNMALFLRISISCQYLQSCILILLKASIEI